MQHQRLLISPPIATTIVAADNPTKNCAQKYFFRIREMHLIISAYNPTKTFQRLFDIFSLLIFQLKKIPALLTSYIQNVRDKCIFPKLFWNESDNFASTWGAHLSWIIIHQTIVFALSVVKYICPNCKMYLSNLFLLLTFSNESDYQITLPDLERPI